MWREDRKSGMKAVLMGGNLWNLLGIRKMDSVPNSRVREPCGVTKGIDERINQSVLWLLCRTEEREKSRIDKRVYKEVYMGSCSVGLPRKRWIDSVNDV